MKWFANGIATHMMSGLSPHLAMLVLLAVFFLAHYLFASVDAYTTALLPVILVTGISIPGVPSRSSPSCCASSLGSWESLRPSRMRRVRSMPTAAIFPPVITGGSARSLERSSSECFSCSEFHGPEYSGRGSGSQKCSKVSIQDGFAGGEIPSRFIL